MRTRISNLFAIAVLVCGAFWCSESRASVCFAANGDCGDTSTDFAESVKPDNGASECAQAGFTKTVLAGWATKPTSTGCGEAYVAEHCPYNSSYVKCCGEEYMYSHCDYPLTEVGRCGMLRACVCDAAFKWLPEKCRDDEHHAIENTPCTQYFKNENNQAVVGDGITYYKNCGCDNPPYKYSKASTSKRIKCNNTGQEEWGNWCKTEGDDTHKYFSGCRCNSSYPKTESLCSDSFGVWRSDKNDNSKHCINLDDNGNWYYTRCCECPTTTYPYTSSALQKGAASMVSCDEQCTNGGTRWRIASCKEGYELVENTKGQKECLPKTCDLAVKHFVAYDSSYAIYRNGKLYSVDRDSDLTESVASGEKRAIIPGDITVSESKNYSQNYSYTYCAKFGCSGTSYSSSQYPNGIKSTAKCSLCCYWDSNDGEAYPVLSAGKSLNPDAPLKPEPNGSYSCGHTAAWNNGTYSSVGKPWICNPATSSDGKRVPHCNSLLTDSGTTFTYKGLGGSNAKDFFSGNYLGSPTSSTWEYRALAHACTSRPTVTYSAGLNFPVTNEGDSAPSNGFYGINIKLTASSDATTHQTFKRPIVLNKSDLTFGNLEVNNSLNVYYSNVTGTRLWDKVGIYLSGSINSTHLFDVNTSYIMHSGFYAAYYNFKFNYIDFIMPATQNLGQACLFATSSECKNATGSTVNPRFATITLPTNGYMTLKNNYIGSGISLYAADTSVKSQKYGTYIDIYGREGSIINSNLHIGYIGNADGYGTPGYDNMAQAMGIQLRNYVTFNLNGDYELALSPLSAVKAYTYDGCTSSACQGSITHSDGKYKKCSAVRDEIWYQYGHTTGSGCTGCETRWASDGIDENNYYVTYVGKDKKSHLKTMRINGTYYRHAYAGCDRFWTGDCCSCETETYTYYNAEDAYIYIEVKQNYSRGLSSNSIEGQSNKYYYHVTCE